MDKGPIAEGMNWMDGITCGTAFFKDGGKWRLG